MCVLVIPWKLNQSMIKAVRVPFGVLNHCFWREARGRSYQKEIILSPAGNSPLDNVSI